MNKADMIERTVKKFLSCAPDEEQPGNFTEAQTEQNILQQPKFSDAQKQKAENARDFPLYFNKEELTYLSLAIREYQRNAMITAWDMESGKVESIGNVAELSSKAAAVSEYLGHRIENKLLEVLSDVDKI